MEKVSIGKIINTKGLKGEIKCIFYSDFIESRFKKGNQLFVLDKNKKNNYLTVKSYKIKNKLLYVFFEEINDVDRASSLKNKELFIQIDKLEKLKEDQFYYFQLLNMSAYYKEKKIGFISEVFSNSIHDIIRVKLENNKTILIPFINNHIGNIDVENKNINLKNLGGIYEN